MKKVFIAVLITLAAFCAGSLFVSCKSKTPAVDPTTTDRSAPVVSVTVRPQPFNPMPQDGGSGLLTATTRVTSASAVASWRFEIQEPEPPHLVFFQREGTGRVPETITWDGRSNSGELVQSASAYPFTLSVTNAYDTATFRGVINTDIIVHREGDILRIIVPSIVFAPNIGDFRGLDPERMVINDLILRRIAEVLNYYGSYRVLVEGHANPTTPPGTRQRIEEERGSARLLGLQPLSEERAGTVVAYLSNLGVSRPRLSPVGRGGTVNRIEFEDVDNWWKNRRVEFILER